jgi:hypothetical protein
MIKHKPKRGAKQAPILYQPIEQQDFVDVSDLHAKLSVEEFRWICPVVVAAVETVYRDTDSLPRVRSTVLRLLKDCDRERKTKSKNKGLEKGSVT